MAVVERVISRRPSPLTSARDETEKKKKAPLKRSRKREDALVFLSSIWHRLSSTSNPPSSLTRSCARRTRGEGAGRATVRGGEKDTTARNWTRVRWSWARAGVASCEGEGVGGLGVGDEEEEGGGGRAEGGGRRVVEKRRSPV